MKHPNASEASEQSVLGAEVEHELSEGETNAAVAAFARSTAHAINNPLAALTADLDLMFDLLRDEESPLLCERVRDALCLLEEARRAAERIRAVVRHLQVTTAASGAAEAPVRHESGAVPAQPGAGASARTMRVLVVDDDPLVGAALKRCLRDYDVVVVDSGLGAMTRLNAGERFELIVCDLMMPEMTGMDLHEAVREAVPEQAERMIFLTGGPVTTRARDFISNVPNLVMDKPFDVHKLREVVRKWAR
jgi:CheY-like chemotaxis protein